jgi:hypothetical protein
LTTESEHFESADEGDIIGDENCHPVTSEFVNRNKTGEKINIKTEFISEISNEDKQEIALLKLTLMQYEKLLILVYFLVVKSFIIFSINFPYTI